MILNISDRIFIRSPGSCPRGGTWGAKVSKIKFSEHSHVAYQIIGDDQWTRIH